MAIINQEPSSNKPDNDIQFSLFSVESLLKYPGLCLRDIFKECGFRKRSGVKPFDILLDGIEMGLAGAKTAYARYNMPELPEARCSYHAMLRFIENPKLNWSRLLIQTGVWFVDWISKLNNSDVITTVAIDDTIIRRDRSKKVEGMSCQFDHATGGNGKSSHTKGFTNLTAMWTDGNSSIALKSALVSTSKPHFVKESFRKGLFSDGAHIEYKPKPPKKKKGGSRKSEQSDAVDNEHVQSKAKNSKLTEAIVAAQAQAAQSKKGKTAAVRKSKSRQHGYLNQMKHGGKVNYRTAGGQARMRAITSKTTLMQKFIDEIDRTLKKAVDYFLMDSWFYSYKLIDFMNNSSRKLICMVKSNVTFRLERSGRAMHLEELLQLKFPYDKPVSSVSSSCILCSTIAWNKQHQKVKLVFIGHRSSPGKFIVLLTNDIKLDDDKIVDLYTRRWDIECMFKLTKQELGLNMYHGRDFDAAVAMNALAFIRFNILELMRRCSIDERSRGDMFRMTKEQLRTKTFAESIEKMLGMVDEIGEQLKAAGLLKDGPDVLKKVKELIGNVVDKWYQTSSEYVIGLLEAYRQRERKSKAPDGKRAAAA